MIPFDDEEALSIANDSRYGLDVTDEFLQTKIVWIHTGEETPDKFSLR